MKTKINIVRSFYHRKWMLAAAYFATVVSLFWSPLQELVISMGWMKANGLPVLLSDRAQSFDRMTGQALLHGVDISKRVSNMRFYGFFYWPLLFLLSWTIIEFLFWKTDEINEGDAVTELHKFLDGIIMASFPALVLTCMTRLDDRFYTMFSPIVYVSVLAIIIHMRFGAKYVSVAQFKWIWFMSLNLMFFYTWISHEIISDVSILLFLYMLLSVMLYAVAFGILEVISVRVEKEGKGEILRKSTLPLYIMPVLVSIGLEVCNILNQYNRYLRKGIVVVVVLGTGVLVSFLLFRIPSITGKIQIDVINIQLICLVLGVSCFAAQTPFQITAGTELFESSNLGSDVFGLLKYGEIPLVDNLNVHMVLDEVGNILYGLLNNDSLGAIWQGYPFITIVSDMLIFGCFVVFVGIEYAVIMMLFWPVSGFSWVFAFSMAFLPMLVGVRALYYHSRFAYIKFVLACVVCCLYRADIGLSSSVACVVIISIYLIWKKKYKDFFNLILTGTVVGAIFGMLYFGACIYRGVSPVARMLEAASLLLANIRWAYFQAADAYDVQFYFCYLFLPLMCFMLMALFLLKFFKQKICSDEAFALIVMMMGIYYLNFSRGIVRHSLAENMAAFCIGFGGIAVIFILWLIRGGRKEHLPLYLCIVFLFQILFGNMNLIGNTLLQTAYIRQSFNSNYELPSHKEERVLIPEELKVIYQPLKTIFDATLDDEETYFDYSADTTLYALTDRNKPVYTNQSPSELNREFDCLLFIDELKAHVCPYALSKINGRGFDRIDFDITHYLVAEYLYEQYRPLCVVGEYAVWVEKDKYDFYYPRVEKLIGSGEVEAAFINDTDGRLIRSYDMGELPRLWASYDKVSNKEEMGSYSMAASSQEMRKDKAVTRFDAEIAAEELQSIDRKDGNYINIHIDTPVEGEGFLELTDKDGNTVGTMSFNMQEGVEDYLFRISSDYLWHTDIVTGISLLTDVPVGNPQISILRGDIDYNNMSWLERKVLKKGVYL